MNDDPDALLSLGHDRVGNRPGCVSIPFQIRCQRLARTRQDGEDGAENGRGVVVGDCAVAEGEEIRRYVLESLPKRVFEVLGQMA